VRLILPLVKEWEWQRTLITAPSDLACLTWTRFQTVASNQHEVEVTVLSVGDGDLVASAQQINGHHQLREIALWP
jgi:hypothetical protein